MIRLGLFGGIELVDAAGRSVTAVLEQPKRLALLVYLALAAPRAFRSRDTALALFWPESDQRRARSALNQALHFLRRSLGPGVIVKRGGGVGTASGALWCDAVAFEQALQSGDAMEALRLYRGDILPGFFIDAAPDFEPWLEEQRVHFRRQARDAARRLAEAAERSGDLAAAVGWARRSSEVSRDDETSLQELLRLLHRVGDRAGALHAYQDFATRLSRDFGAAPSAETRRLMDAIRARAESTSETGSVAAAQLLPRELQREGTSEELSSRSRVAEVAGEVPVAEAARRRAPAAERGRLHSMRPRLRWLTAAMVVTGLLALWSLAHRTPGDERPPATSSHVRIAVHEFADLTAPSSRGILGSAITAAVVDRLAAVRSFEVTPGSTPAEPERGDAGAVRDPLFLVTGSVLRSGGRIRVNVELMDAAAGRTLRTAVVEHDSSESMGLVDALSREVTSMVRVAVGRELRARARHARGMDAGAQALVEQASAERERAHWLEREGRVPTAARALIRADSLLVGAEAIAPEWREPAIERARTLWELAVLHFSPPLRDATRAGTLLRAGIAEAGRAVSSDDTDARALEALGLLSYWYWMQAPLAADSAQRSLARATGALQRAVAIDPGRASAWSLLSATLYARADFSGAYLAADRAFQADAYLDDAEEILNRLFVAAYEIGDDAGSRRWCDEINRRFPRSWTGAYCRLSLLAWNGAPGDRAAARRAWEIAAEGDPPAAPAPEMRPRLHMLVAAVLARAGLRDSAAAMIRSSRRYAGDDQEILPIEASAQLLIGQPDSAAALLARYVGRKPFHRAAVACSRRFVSLRALRLHRAVFGRCAVYSASAERRAGPTLDLSRPGQGIQ